MSSNLFSPAGGLRYHLRALRHRRGLWSPFRIQLTNWLLSWNAGVDHLVIIGPSGGYSLAGEFLARFRKITAIDPDPLARFIFSRRLSALGIECESLSEDLLIRPLLRGTPGLDTWLAQRPTVAVLFANVLGQVRFLLEEDEHAAWLDAFRTRIGATLDQRHWASYHDRVSGFVTPSLVTPLTTARALDDVELVERFYRDQAVPAELSDHLTLELFAPNLERTYFTWELEAGHHFVIEGIRSSGSSCSYQKASLPSRLLNSCGVCRRRSQSIGAHLVDELQ